MDQDNRELFDFEIPAPDADRILKVKDLNRVAKELLERSFPLVMVEGEISNFKRHMPSGHLYFTLKDDEAQVRVVMWRSDAVRLRFEISDGMKMIVKGKVSLYESRGDFQLYAISMVPAGQGVLQLAFEQLKKKLEAEGLFREEHKRPLPEFPRRIGVVTSIEGAAVRDIISVIRRRFPLVELVVIPVKVQGEGAAAEIARAIQQMNRLGNVDVLIVGRGGGSLEDLWAFNEEVVARAIYDSKIPVISAVGHQVDYTISDFVADVRAATPSAAAELVVPDRLELLAGLQSTIRSMSKSVIQNTERLTLELDRFANHYALQQPASNVEQKSQFVDELTERLQTHTLHFFEKNVERIAATESRLNALSPYHVLRRGYAFVEGPRGVVRSVRNVEIGDETTIHLQDGTLDSRITGKHGQER